MAEMNNTDVAVLNKYGHLRYARPVKCVDGMWSIALVVDGVQETISPEFATIDEAIAALDQWIISTTAP